MIDRKKYLIHAKPDSQARKLLQPVGGCLVQVHMEPGGRVSYGPYRAAGKALIQLLKRWVLLPEPPLNMPVSRGERATVEQLNTAAGWTSAAFRYACCWGCRLAARSMAA